MLLLFCFLSFISIAFALNCVGFSSHIIYLQSQCLLTTDISAILNVRITSFQEVQKHSCVCKHLFSLSHYTLDNEYYYFFYSLSKH